MRGCQRVGAGGEAGEKLPGGLQLDRAVVPGAERARLVLLVVQCGHELDHRVERRLCAALALVGAVYGPVAVVERGIFRPGDYLGFAERLRQQPNRQRRQTHVIHLRLAVEGLLVAGGGVRKVALERDAPLLRDLQAQLGLEHVDGDAGAALHALVLEFELTLDRAFVGAGELEQTGVAQHVEIRRYRREEQVLLGGIQGDLGDRLTDLRRCEGGRRAEPVEHGLGDRERGTLPPYGQRAAAIATRARAVGNLPPEVG